MTRELSSLSTPALRKLLAWITAASTVEAIRLIELGARFCADALNESYFGWNPARFASRSEHNQVRAAGQLALHDLLCAQLGEVEKAVQTAFNETN